MKHKTHKTSLKSKKCQLQENQIAKAHFHNGCQILRNKWTTLNRTNTFLLESLQNSLWKLSSCNLIKAVCVSGSASECDARWLSLGGASKLLVTEISCKNKEVKTWKHEGQMHCNKTTISHIVCWERDLLVEMWQYARIWGLDVFLTNKSAASKAKNCVWSKLRQEEHLVIPSEPNQIFTEIHTSFRKSRKSFPGHISAWTAANTSQEHKADSEERTVLR